MLIRILSAVVSIPLMILMLIFSVKYPIIINIFFMLVSAFGVYEYISAILVSLLHMKSVFCRYQYQVYYMQELYRLH